MYTATDEFGRQDRSGNRNGDLTGKEKVIDRIRKVLALTQSPNEHEAASAATKLSEMLAEHNLSVADLEAKGQAAPGMREQPHDLGKAAFKWKLDLAEGIAEFYYCAPIVNRITKSVAFVGRPDNVEALTMLYAWVIEQVKVIAREERRVHFDKTGEHIDPLRWQVGFGEGAVERLIVRLREMKVRQEEDMSRNQYGDIQALVLHRQTEVSDYLEEKFGYRLDGKKTKAERESDERWAKWDEERIQRAAAHDALLAQCQASGDMAPYYAEYPWNTPEALAKRQRSIEADRKREERNARRRTGSYRERKVDWEKEGQSRSARESGKAAAGKVNLQPFITGHVDNKKKVG